MHAPLQKRSPAKASAPASRPAARAEAAPRSALLATRSEPRAAEARIDSLSLARSSRAAPVPVQKRENRTGLPDRLKAGVEGLSGVSLDDVRVHYNSPRPAQLQADAFAEGTQIHVGPGHARHLAHEAWHVVQQKQGRVTAAERQDGLRVNDDPGLEAEADRMGTRALGFAVAVSNPLEERQTVSPAIQLSQPAAGKWASLVAAGGPGAPGASSSSSAPPQVARAAKLRESYTVQVSESFAQKHLHSSTLDDAGALGVAQTRRHVPNTVIALDKSEFTTAVGNTPLAGWVAAADGSLHGTLDCKHWVVSSLVSVPAPTTGPVNLTGTPYQNPRRLSIGHLG